MRWVRNMPHPVNNYFLLIFRGGGIAESRKSKKMAGRLAKWRTSLQLISRSFYVLTPYLSRIKSRVYHAHLSNRTRSCISSQLTLNAGLASAFVGSVVWCYSSGRGNQICCIVLFIFIHIWLIWNDTKRWTVVSHIGKNIKFVSFSFVSFSHAERCSLLEAWVIFITCHKQHQSQSMYSCTW